MYNFESHKNINNLGNLEIPRAEIRMLKWMCGHTRRDMILNKDIEAKVGVDLVEDKMQEVRLRWLRHVKKKCMNGPV